MHVQLATKEPNDESKKTTFSQASRLTTFYSKILRRDNSQMGILLLKLPSPNEKKQNSTFGPPSWTFQNPPIQHQQNFPIGLKLNQVIQQQICHMQLPTHESHNSQDTQQQIIDSIEHNIEFDRKSSMHKISLDQKISI